MAGEGGALRLLRRSAPAYETGPSSGSSGRLFWMRRARSSPADAFWICAVRRCASRLPPAARRETKGRSEASSIPLQKKKFRAESRAERRRKRDIALIERPLFQPFLKDEQNSGAGEIANVAENIPGWLGVALGQSQSFLNIEQQTRATGMQDPTANLVASHAVTRQEAVHERFYLFTDHFRNIFRKQYVKTRILQIESHGAERIGESVCFRNKNAWPRRGGFAADNHGGSAVAEQNRGD